MFYPGDQVIVSDSNGYAVTGTVEEWLYDVIERPWDPLYRVRFGEAGCYRLRQSEMIPTTYILIWAVATFLILYASRKLIIPNT